MLVFQAFGSRALSISCIDALYRLRMQCKTELFDYAKSVCPEGAVFQKQQEDAMKVVRAMWRGLHPHLKGKLVAGEELTAEEVGVVGDPHAMQVGSAAGEVAGPGKAAERGIKAMLASRRRREWLEDGCEDCFQEALC